MTRLREVITSSSLNKWAVVFDDVELTPSSLTSHEETGILNASPLHPFYYIRTIDKNNKVFKIFTGRRSAVVKALSKELSKVYIAVFYYPTVWNNGTYDNSKDAMDVLRIWTEKQQLESMAEKYFI